MDPDATYYAMYEAVRDKRYDEARELAINLREWLDKGGCWPQKYSREEVRSYSTSVLLRTTPTVRDYRPDWLAFIKNLDIKGSDWPWCDDKWDDIERFIIRILWSCDNKITGFGIFRFDSRDLIQILKLIAVKDKELLLNSIEQTAKKQGIDELSMIIWEHAEKEIKWATEHGFKAIGISGKFPDGSDGYKFRKVIP